MLSRSDELNRDISAQHHKLSLLIATDKGISRGNMEELYFYLKEQVASGMDLASMAEELHDHVYNLVSSSKASEVITLLLDMTILEDEQMMLKRKIFTYVNESAGGSAAYQEAAFQEIEESLMSESKALFGGGILDEKDAPQERKEALDSLSEEKTDSRGVQEGGEVLPIVALDESKQSGAVADAKASSIGGDAELDSKADAKDANAEAKDGKATEEDKKDMKDVMAKDEPPRLPAPSKMGDPAVDAVLSSLKDKHKAALANLQAIVDEDRLKKMKSLEDRLLLKKMQLADRRASAGSNGADEETDKKVVAVLKEEIAEIQAEIEGTNASFEKTKEGFLSIDRAVSVLRSLISPLRHRLDEGIQEEVPRGAANGEEHGSHETAHRRRAARMQ
jgi:hypothetical protein